MSVSESRALGIHPIPRSLDSLGNAHFGASLDISHTNPYLDNSELNNFGVKVLGQQVQTLAPSPVKTITTESPATATTTYLYIATGLLVLFFLLK